MLPVKADFQEGKLDAKVTELMNLCDRLEAGIIAGADARHALLEVTLRDALTPALHPAEASAA